MKVRSLLPVAATGLVALPGAAMAQATTPATVDMTPISDAVIAGMSQGITVLLALAPIVILFSVVWGIINRGKQVAK